jgi:colanic acid biosynthesis glycosyl transferase WcaI
VNRPKPIVNKEISGDGGQSVLGVGAWRYQGSSYAPELTGIGKYTGEMAAWLAAQGHIVSVIAAVPYYPEWCIHDAYQGRGWHTEHVKGVQVYRCPLYVPQKVTSLKRILHESSFQAASLPVWLRLLWGAKPDVIICISPPFHTGLLPWLFSRLWRVPLLVHLQDLQVDAAQDLGMIQNQRFLKLMFRLEKMILGKSTAVSTISEGMKRKLIEKGIPSSKIVLFPNWVDAEQIYPLPVEQSLRKELGLSPEHRVVLYAGNLGEKQGLEIIVEAAKHFVAQPEVVFVVVGSGGGKEKLQGLARTSGLSNIRFFPLQPYEKLSALLAAADVHLVLQKRSASDLVMPSKLTGILAAGGCALVTAMPGTTLYAVINEHRMGIVIEPESADALYNGIVKTLATDLSIYRANARTYAKDHLNMEVLLRGFEKELKALVV